MARLLRVTARQIIPALEKVGFVLSRQSGSHRIYKHPNGKRVTVPFHAQKTLHPKVLRSILRDAELSVAELKRLL